MFSPPTGVSRPLSQVGELDMDFLASRFNSNLDMFATGTRDPQSFTVNALVATWDQFILTYAFPPLKLLSHLLCRIEIEGVSMILILTDLAEEDVVLRSQTPSGLSVGLTGLTRSTVTGATSPYCFLVSGLKGLAVVA